MHSWPRGLVTLGVIVSVMACGKPELPTFVPIRARVTAVTPVGIDLVATLSATNPNRIDIPMRGVSGHLVLHKTTDLGIVTIPFPNTLPGNQTTTLDVPLSVPWRDLLALGQLAALNTEIPYTMDGSVGLGGELVNVEIPFHLEGTVTQNQLIDAARNSIPGLKGMPGLRGLLPPSDPPHHARTP